MKQALKTGIISAIFIIWIVGLASTQTTAKKPEPDFRKCFWGASLNEVLVSEGITLEDCAYESKGNKSIIVFTDEDIDSLIGFIFIKDKLIRARIIPQEEHYSKNKYLDDYKDLKYILDGKYGERPVFDTWHDKLFIDDVSQYGLAISIGHLELNTFWVTKTTEIVLFLEGDNFEIKFGVEYISIDLIQLEEKEKELASKDKY